ncbi:MAG: ABC transporter permease [Chloroflexi bacterium]|nr:ABC transporter permease [Chloroflexota bacterium]
MGKYIIRRILQAIPLLLIIAVLTFVLLKTVGDPLQYLVEDPRVTEAERFRLRAVLGLNDPLPLQFVHWLIGDDWYLRDIDNDGEGDVYGERRGVLRGDFGESIRVRNRDAIEIIGEKLPNTLLLGITVYVVTITVSLAVGIFAATHPYSLADNIITSISFVFFSMPIYLVALIMIYIFAVQFRLAHDGGLDWLPYLPVQGMRPTRGATGTLAELAWHMVLPVFSLASISIAGYSRFVRASMLEVINSDYIRTAHAKGLSNRRITFLHALKNASLPLVTLVGLDVPFILGGAVVTEQIFSWDGMGLLFIRSLEALDAPVLILFTMMTAIAVVVMQLVTDVTYAWLDPRVRFS